MINPALEALHKQPLLQLHAKLLLLVAVAVKRKLVDQIKLKQQSKSST